MCNNPVYIKYSVYKGVGIKGYIVYIRVYIVYKGVQYIYMCSVNKGI